MREEVDWRRGWGEGGWVWDGAGLVRWRVEGWRGGGVVVGRGLPIRG